MVGRCVRRPEGVIELRCNRPQVQSTSEVEWSMRRPEGAIDLRGGMVDAAPGGAQSTSEVELSMRRPEGAQSTSEVNFFEL